ncbi:MAG: hypothetical protein A2Y03_04545 [Omnitrophica WOR_2 bacterium GWF2_38_59]|nr:MAG: hypothetical protein A2Y03_04545 [Omnitrophica WOR_2 bacterium GWF2_38_59]OGX49956.1 MAG: hypothetical protein A2243_11500 [Omnitrophica WOR_2 bacterium RIFOXYA2_FULL_38_17]OGX53680.1 MAG: hypothetical protein A2267_10035 [Omnitrophica WOR_2 bacterium RIFOXYA12_FULL_38_10]OGX56379.1 MAG: hypothetical protein A2306_00640 [Omnitrophica WOR_2 bacterium RIFOXYB2_FULL_38_16]OGX58109.1 MAG: hypothetical protein A2447_01320 [Omnitrophica WOR_2 bacterium RIFOXYC2_FULL_38_12]HBG60763.1 hydrolas
MKIAVIQFNAGANKENNIERACFFVEKAISKQAKFILLPEVFVFRGNLAAKRVLSKVAESIEGNTIKKLSLIAKKNKVAVLAGSIYEKIYRSKKVYNLSVLIGPDGKIAAKYRKINLFDANVDGQRIREANIFKPGDNKAIAKVGGMKAGLSICFDLRYPELYRYYCLKGAEILCVPSAFTHTTGKDHWETLLRARAIENKCFVLAPNQIGKNGQGVLCYGNSMIVDPWGKILARASNNKEEIIYADINKEAIIKVRTVLGRK